MSPLYGIRTHVHFAKTFLLADLRAGGLASGGSLDALASGLAGRLAPHGVAEGAAPAAGPSLPEGVENVPVPAIATAGDMTPEEAAVESVARPHTLANYKSLLGEYVRRSVRGSQVVINSDEAKPLIKGYGVTPEERVFGSAAVHPSAAAVALGAYRYTLQHWPDPAKDEVDFLTGMQGTGKTTLRESGALDHVGIVYERNMSDPATARALIRSAIDAGKKPVIDVLVPSDPMDSIDRAVGRIHTEGRPVPADYALGVYKNVARVVPQLKDEFGDRIGLNVYRVLPGKKFEVLPGQQGIDLLRGIADNRDTESLVRRADERIGDHYTAGRITRRQADRAIGLYRRATGGVLQEGTPGESADVLPVAQGRGPLQSSTAGKPQINPTENEPPQRPGPSARMIGTTGEGKSADPLGQLADSILRNQPERPEPAEIGGAVPASRPGIVTRAKGAVQDFLKPIPRPYERAIEEYSGAMGERDQAADRFMRGVAHAVPRLDRQNAIMAWAEAGGDDATLAKQAERLKAEGKLAAKYYEIAQRLTPDEKSAGQNIRNYLDEMHAQAKASGVIKGFRENYIPRVTDTAESSGAKQGQALARFSKSTRYGRERQFPTRFDAEMAAYKPRWNGMQAISDYSNSVTKAIATRELQNLLLGTNAEDNRPFLSPSGMGRTIKEEGEPSAHLALPFVKPEEREDYVSVNHPAFRKFTYAGSDEEGHPILTEGPLVAHPSIAGHLRRVMEPSLFQNDTKAAMLGRAALRANTFGKKLLFGFSPMHMVSEGSRDAGLRPTACERG